MKTLKWLKLSFIWQAIYVVFCVASITCFEIYHVNDQRLLFNIGMLLILGWFANPVGIVTPIVGMTNYFIEKKNTENKAIIGWKWIWFIMLFLFDTLLYMLAGARFVNITGGV